MDVKELRIGNHLRCYDVDIIVGSINSEYVQSLNLSDGQFKISDCEPIPITEDWLKGFGFGKVIGWFITTRPNISLELSENNDNSTKQWYCYIRNLNGVGNPDDFALLRKDLIYIHQIQNIYFDLTNQELTLTPHLHLKPR